MQTIHFKLKLVVAIACLFGGLSGCSQLSVVNSLNPFGNKHNFIVATPENPAVEILALWQPAEGPGPNGLPSRGFAGQVYFFTRGSESPAKVNGDVRIFVFDDVGTHKEQAKPISQFGYTADVWNMHLSDSMLGPSYQVFVPYVRRDPHRVNCTLSLNYTAPNTQTLYSKMVSVTLPGPVRSEPKTEQSAESKEEAARTKADDVLREEFAKFVNKRGSSTGATSGPTSTDQLNQEATAATDVKSVVQASAIHESATPSADELRIRQLEEQLRELHAESNRGGTTEPSSKAASDLCNTPRFRLGSQENDASDVPNNVSNHPLETESASDLDAAETLQPADSAAQEAAQSDAASNDIPEWARDSDAASVRPQSQDADSLADGDPWHPI